jgi:hypothetical protein
MKKPRNNALLEWKGRKLMCNGVCVATIWEIGPTWWIVYIGDAVNPVQRKTKEAARRAVNRRFKITEA